MVSKKKQKQLPRDVRDELRRVLAVRCFDMVCKKSSMKQSQQEDLMFRHCHGDTNRNIISQLNLLLAAEEPCKDLFEPIASNVVDASTSVSAATMKLKRVHLQGLADEDGTFRLGEEINDSVMRRTTFKDEAIVSGRNLLSLAKSTLAQTKKALAFLETIMPSMRTGWEWGQ